VNGQFSTVSVLLARIVAFNTYCSIEQLGSVWLQVTVTTA